MSKLNGVVWYRLPNATNLWQPQTLKTLICQSQRRWLDNEKNAEKWYGHDNSFSSKERRILIAHWVGEAYKKLNSSEYNHLWLQVWQKTGCLITADETDDDLIKPEGLKSYVVPLPAFLQPSTSLLQVEENSVSREEHTTVSEEDANIVDPSEEQPSDSEIQENNLEHRVYDGDLVGRKVTALYGNGWFTGIIVYFNMKLKEYKVDYADETSDYLLSDDFDGVKVILEYGHRQ